MALVRTIVRDALIEIGVCDPLETPSAEKAALGLLRFQHQLDAWAADRLTLSLQLRTVFTLPSGTSAITIGTGEAVDIVRPLVLNTVNYIIPGSSPSIEVVMAPMDQDSYASQSIKDLSSALPLQYFYQTNQATATGTLTVWPVPSQDIEIVLYSPQAIGIPATLDTDVAGPSGYAEAFLYQLAFRLCTPFGIGGEIRQNVSQMAREAFATMKRPNITPGLLSVDAALVPMAGGGYNILSDSWTSGR